MTRRQTELALGEAFDRLCTLACERKTPTYKPGSTKLQIAASWLYGFAAYCRDNLIDPATALKQAVITQLEQPTRTAEDYASEARKAREAAQASATVPSPDNPDFGPGESFDGAGAR